MSHLRIKICGITREEDGRQAALLGADAIGVNFCPQSLRYVSMEKAQAILRELPPFVDPVGLFVNDSLQQVFQTLNQLGRLRIFQWHGNRPPEWYDTDPFQMIVAFSVRDEGSLREISRYLELCRELGHMPAAVLVDAYVPGQYGGTGRQAPWQLLADFEPPVPLILAGGLTPDNVAEAVRLVQPYAIDVASGVEVRPGQKDPDKMRRFIDNARAAR